MLVNTTVEDILKVLEGGNLQDGDTISIKVELPPDEDEIVEEG